MRFAMDGVLRLFGAGVAFCLCLFSTGCLDVGIFNSLTVRSANPSSGVPIEVASTDRNDASAAATSFTRLFKHGTVITLTAPASSNGNIFSSWAGCTSSASATCKVTLTGDTTVTATYVTPASGSTAEIDNLINTKGPLSLNGHINDQSGDHRTSSDFDLITTGNPLIEASNAGILEDQGNLTGNNAQDQRNDYRQVSIPISEPAITTAGVIGGKLGTVFSYQIMATNTPSSFSAIGLPAGLSIDSSTGLIWGIPVNKGVANVSLSATNTRGTATATVNLMISED